MLTPNRPAASKASRMGFFRSRQIKSSGGSSETEQKALIVEPTGSSPSQVVTMVTPDGKHPIAARHSAGVGQVGEVSDNRPHGAVRQAGAGDQREAGLPRVGEQHFLV